MDFEEQFKERTKEFALSVLRTVERVPTTAVAGVLVKQLIRSATSVGANYRAACRARSPADFIAKLAIAQEESDESEYWLELLGSLDLIRKDECLSLRDEGHQLTAILTRSIKTAKSRS